MGWGGVGGVGVGGGLLMIRNVWERSPALGKSVCFVLPQRAHGQSGF